MSPTRISISSGRLNSDWSLLRTCSSKILLKLEEEFKLLELLIIDNSSIGIVGVVGGPLKEGLIFVGDCTESKSSLNARDLMSRLSWEDLISEGVLDIWDLIDSQLPFSSVGVVDENNWVELVWASGDELGRLNVGRQQLLKLEVLEDAPSLLNSNWEDSALSLACRNRNSRTLTFEFHSQ